VSSHCRDCCNWKKRKSRSLQQITAARRDVLFIDDLCLFVRLFVRSLAGLGLHENDYIYRHETFRMDGQLFSDEAFKFYVKFDQRPRSLHEPQKSHEDPVSPSGECRYNAQEKFAVPEYI